MVVHDKLFGAVLGLMFPRSLDAQPAPGEHVHPKRKVWFRSIHSMLISHIFKHVSSFIMLLL